VYSGTTGVTRLADTSSVLREIFLYVNGNTRQIPVPKLYYKIIVNLADSSGAVFIGVNNPHLTLAEIQRDYIICTDYSSQINYITWQKDNIERGYSYVCTVADFLRVVPHVSLNVSRLLV
jgi:DNA/RNA non-specific endonuclease